MQCAEIIEAIEKIAPPWAQSSWDRSGIQVASSRKTASRMAVCLDATPALVEDALAGGCEFILSHHPLALHPDLPNKLNGYHRVLQLLFGANVPLYAAHTSLDVNPLGPAGWLGHDLGLNNTTILESINGAVAGSTLGFGMAGDLPEPMAVEALEKKLLELLHIDNARLCGPKCGGEIRRIAYCGGSGSSLIDAAISAGAEYFITGDIKYHTALDSCLAIIDVGHHSIEEEMMRRMAAQLNQTLAGLEVIFLPSRDPFTFVGSGCENK